MLSFSLQDQLQSLDISGFSSFEVRQTQDLLEDHQDVKVAIVRAKENKDGRFELVAFIVPYPEAYDRFCLERFQKDLNESNATAQLPKGYVILSNVPLNAVGEVDNLALMSLAVATQGLDSQLEGSLLNIPEVEQAAALWKVLPPQGKSIHITDLLPMGLQHSQDDKPASLATLAEREHFAPVDQPLALADGGALVVPENAPKTLTEALLKTVATFPDKGMRYIESDETTVTLSYTELLAQARCILTGLRQAGLKAGDRVILQTQTFSDHFPMFWGCLLGGIIPITIAVAPAYDENNAVARKLFNIWNVLNHVPIVASAALVDKIEDLQHCLPMNGVAVLSIEDLRQNTSAEELHPTKPTDVLFIQLSSGSTGVPKCIQVTHQGVIAHIQSSQQFNSYSADDISLNWLPLDHVVPMLTFHLKDTYLGCQQIEVATSLIVGNPLRWLDVMAAHKVTHSWSPNFGFKLVSDALSSLPPDSRRQWDLSSIKLLMNAGEQVTRLVVDNFLKSVAPFGVPAQAMQPAFGMAELCTCMTYHNHYGASTWGYRMAKASLRSHLQVVDEQCREATDFVHLGPPVPGVQMRIVNADNDLLEEGVIGRLQIKGAVVTPGYLNNPEANAEAFVKDGWFNTGDLGFLRDRHLVITGREKEIIIINGANFYCYEIEDVVNAIAGVRSTYTAAVSYHDQNTGSEGLAVFFVPKRGDISENMELIRSIKTQITASLGISPTYVLPLSEARFPKTTSGKIQRMGLKTGLLQGEFESLIKKVEVGLGQNTLPSWFYRPVWRRKSLDAYSLKGLTTGQTVVFSDALGLAQQFCREFARREQATIQVVAGLTFSQLNSHCYSIDPHRSEDYDRLFAHLQARGIVVTQIVHLWTYAPPSEISAAVHLEGTQIWGSLSLLSLIQSANRYYSDQQIALHVVSQHTQQVHKEDVLAIERSPLLGLLKTAAQEMPWLSYRHIDFANTRTAEQVAQDCNALLQEVESTVDDASIAYRNQQRWVQKLAPVDFTQIPAQPLPFELEGLYIISGGLGGVGLKVSKYLLENFSAKLLILGRTPLSPELDTPVLDNDAGTHDSGMNAASTKRQAAYQSLVSIGKGQISYAAVDLTDIDQLSALVRQTADDWDCKLKGVVHLAGVFEERSLADEQRSAFLQVLRPKMCGSWVLHQLIKENPQALFISYSSVNGFFGGQSVGAYAAANSFVEQFSLHQQQSIRSYCYAWSMWNELGMSKGYQLKALTRTKGFHLIEPEQGLTSLWAGLSHAQSHLIIGLDGSNSNIRSTIARPAETHQALVAYVATKKNSKGHSLSAAEVLELAASRGSISLRDDFNTAIIPKIKVLDALPLTESGKIDKAALQEMADGKVFVAPQTPLEESLADIWQQLLGISRIGRHDNFFEIGGNSLLTVQLTAQIQEVLGKSLTLADLFAAPTIAMLAEIIAGVTHAAKEAIDLKAEAVLSKDIYPTTPFVFTEHPKLIFLTGATGFLGGSLLATMLAETKADIVCLVRAATIEAAIARIQQNLIEQKLWQAEWAKRIVPVLGDLAKPQLGLSRSDFDRIAQNADIIYHNGAWVNFTYPYSALKQTNVTATEEVLRIATLSKLKAVHFVSTISVCFSDAYRGKTVQEDETLLSADDLSMGYAQSKWVSEQLLMQARDRGIPVCIYRPGRIMGHSTTGYSNTQDLICRMLKQVVQLGSAPSLSGSVDMTPIDFVSQALVKLSLQEASLGSVFHLINPRLIEWQQLFSDIQAIGYPLTIIDCQQWRQQLMATARSDAQQAMHPLLDLFSTRIPFETADPLYACQNTLKGLSGTPLSFPAVNREMLQNYFRYFEQSGYLADR